MIIRDDIVKAAKCYIGTPFVHQGRSRNGIDCIGLIICVGKDLGLTNYDYVAYERSPDRHIFMNELRSNLVHKYLQERQPGDILTFALPRYPCHVGIYCGSNLIIHALFTRGMVVEHHLDERWMNLARECYSFNGVL